MRWFTLPIALVLACASVAQQKPNMDWWRKARFGMFIHFGLYAIPAGKWGKNTNYAEWIRNEAHIPVKEYEKFQKEFNPYKFNADRWVKLAKDAGMQYVTITTKHHDGFCLFDSKYTTWDITHTPYHKDIMKQMAAACKKEGLKMCWYHSIMDWHEPDYLPRRDWEVAQRPVDGADYNRYKQYLFHQVTELLTHYGPIGVMWFDGNWEPTWTAKDGQELYDLCKKLQPNVIVNNRVSGSGGPQIGDYSTPEQYIPSTGLPGVDWETCMTMNDHWGYNAYDKDWKSPETLIHNLIDIASKGGNYLLNIGPMANGEFPPQAIERLKAIGRYMKVNGQAIYDTTASVFDTLPWGRSTTKRNGSTTTLYLHVWDWPSDGRLVVPSIGNEPVKATLLGPGENLATEREGSDIVVQVPATAPDPISSTVALVVEGAPIVYKVPKIMSGAQELVDHVTVSIEAGPGSEVRYTTDGSDPDGNSPIYTEPFQLTDAATVKAASFRNGERVSSVAESDFQKVSPTPGLHLPTLQEGLRMREYKGHFTKMPDFESMNPQSDGVALSLSVPEKNGIPEEYVGRYYTGFLVVPKDDVYRFELTSDDGAQMWLDGKLLIDNDGLHSSSLKSATAALGEGQHRLAISWYNYTGGAELKLDWGRADGKLTPLELRAIVHERHMPRGAPTGRR